MIGHMTENKKFLKITFSFDRNSDFFLNTFSFKEFAHEKKGDEV